MFPEVFAFDPSFETSAIRRRQLVGPDIEDDAAGLEIARAELGRRVKALRRSIHIRHVDGGSDGSEEWEVAALTNPIYDVQRLGIFFTATPRHADVLLVTGVGTAGMAGPLRRTFDAMPDPKVVIAAGTDAVSGGLVHPSYATGPGIGSIVPVDVWVPGSPPSPFSLLHGILVGIGLLTEGSAP
jgi:Ni,Fe-hydrogenase III small subunit